MRRLTLISFLALQFLIAHAARAAHVDLVVLDSKPSPRVQFATQLLSKAIDLAADSPQARSVVLKKVPGIKPEGFSIDTNTDGSISIHASDDSGLLYGCMELASRIRDTKQLPTDLHFTDATAFKLRGPCIGMQKPYLLPGRKVYEYPYTPELFPFFYDKQFWTEYLDFLAENRFNTLYLWSGHPFASLVRVPDYPYAVEVSDDVFAKNVEMFHWIAAEADKRGIWVVQMFYNILIPKPLAEKNGLETQLAAPNPIAADYTRKSIAEFVKQYPNVGLMVCLGEALQGIDNQKEWLCDVILPGVKDGMKEAGLTEEPPIVLRTHTTDLRLYMTDALKVYKNLYTEAKFNGESLTTFEPRGERQQLHLAMSKLGSTHLINIHILANLEPFRYGAVRFIQKCVIAGRDRLGARGIHLFPLSYWNWPDSPDAVDPPLKQWRRDWIWFEAWGRYSWNPDIDATTDHAYWIKRLADMYGNNEAAENILAAYNDSGECAPRLIRRFGITEGNRQTLSLGMTLDELVDPDKYHAFDELWESQSPPGERLQEYVNREWNKQPHDGETPPQIIEEVLQFSKQACDEIDAAEPGVTKNRDEFERLRNDVHCIRAMSQNYAAKASAAMCVLRYQHSHDIADMEKAQQYLSESLDHYREMVSLTEHTYRFANSMQTRQRRVPVSGGKNGKPANYLWSQLLPLYEKELADFQKRVNDLKNGAVSTESSQPLPKASFKLTNRDLRPFEVQVGAKVFSDQPSVIRSLAPELRGLVGVQIPMSAAYEPIEFTTTEPVQVLLGYFRSKDKTWRQVPELETDAAAAEHGGVEPLLLNALSIDSLPPVDVYAQTYDAGTHKLEVRGNGAFLILGFVRAKP